MKIFIILALVILLSSIAGDTARAVVYVDASATGDQTGSSWVDAAATISAGIALATTGEQLWVRGDVYSESVVLNPELSLYGGFSGNETSLEQRNWLQNATIIDATGTGSRAVTGAAGAVVDGFKVTGGDAEFGGGIACEYISMSIANCEVMDNHASVGGAGIYVRGDSSVSIENCRIRDNNADTVGAGIFFWGDSGSSVRDCTIEFNTAFEQGGGVFTVEQAAPTFENCYFIDNLAMDGGGVSCESSSPIFTNCVFIGNKADSLGGGIFWSSASPVFNHITMTANIASSSGGAIFSGQPVQPSMVNSILWGNDPNSISEPPSVTQFDVTWSNIEGAYSGDGNINIDPQFVSPWDGSWADIHLSASSPCIDAGTTLLSVSEDFEGDLRPFDIPGVGFDGENNGFDMGTDEYIRAGFSWDVNGDLIVDAEDLLFFLKDTDNRESFFFEFASYWYQQQ